MTAAVDRGLAVADFKEMEIGAIVDYIITYNNLHFKGNHKGKDAGSSKEGKTVIRRATQDDWDRFSR